MERKDPTQTVVEEPGTAVSGEEEGGETGAGLGSQFSCLDRFLGGICSLFFVSAAVFVLRVVGGQDGALN